MEWLRQQYERGVRGVTLGFAGLGVLFALQILGAVEFTYVAVPEEYTEIQRTQTGRAK